MTKSGSEPPEVPNGIPLLHFRTKGLPDAEAKALWCQMMAPLFHVEQARYTSAVPRGSLSVFVIGEIIVNRCTFSAQRCWRDKALIETTPDHLLLQYYRSGGFRGTIAGRPVCIVRGQVTVADLRREMDCYVANSDTIGLSVPHSLLGDFEAEALTGQLDAPRNRLLGGYMSTLPRRLARMTVADIPRLTDELRGMLTRVLAPGVLDDIPPAIGDDLRDRALATVEAHLAMPDLSPAFVADRLGTSRATLFRLFAPMGGIMRYVQERRLIAVREELADPLDTRSLSQFAAAHGFTSIAVLSRGFRARFGMSPREWRREQTNLDLLIREPSPDPIQAVWRELGRVDRGT